MSVLGVLLSFTPGLTGAAGLEGRSKVMLQNHPLPSAPYQRAADIPLPKPVTLTTLSTPALYSIGDPTPEEQLYLEFINRSRANPVAEAQLFRETTDPDVVAAYNGYGVDLNLMTAQFSEIAPAPPLSFNARLIAAARVHSQDMLANQFQEHNGSDGSTFGSRITAQGYQWTLVAENIFSRAQSVWQGHAAFDVDWGGDASSGGMQNPAGHRRNIHEAQFSEIGIGNIKGTNGTVGPQVVTQDFGRAANVSPFVTGVAYYDLNGNGFYELGEGLGGVTVRIAGAQFYAVTASSGGYSVPVPRDGSYSVTFTLPGQTDLQKSVIVAGNKNVKLDFHPAYSPPIVIGADRPSVNQNNNYQFTLVPGATSYQWKQARLVAATVAEGAESGLSNVTAVVSAGYQPIDFSVKRSGIASFHLAHPQDEDQILTLNRLFKGTAASQLVFFSRLGVAGSAQIAKAQISTNRGNTWQDIWKQTGTGDRGDLSFVRQSLSLAPFAGQELQVRFRYDLLDGGIYYPQTDPEFGLYLDDISVTDAEELLDEMIADVSGTSFQFRPRQTNTYALSVRAKLPGDFLPWGPGKLVVPQAGGAVEQTVRIIAMKWINGAVEINFETTGGNSGGFVVERAADVSGPWKSESSATIQSSGPPNLFRATTTTSAADKRQFYRLRAN